MADLFFFSAWLPAMTDDDRLDTKDIAAVSPRRDMSVNVFCTRAPTHH